MQESEHTLFCITDSRQINGGKSEILSKISSLIGLTYEQFTRAVLLAQGEFSAFLKASPNEKADILEKLTGTDIYALISERIFQKTKDGWSPLKDFPMDLNFENWQADAVISSDGKAIVFSAISDISAGNVAS